MRGGGWGAKESARRGGVDAIARERVSTRAGALTARVTQLQGGQLAMKVAMLLMISF